MKIKGIFQRILWKIVRMRKSRIKKLNLGCGDAALEGYINIDVVAGNRKIDFVADIADLSFLETDVYEEIRLDAVFEHLWKWQQLPFLRECIRALRKGGTLAINWLPDFERIMLAWQRKEHGNVSPLFDLYEVYRYTHGEPKEFNSWTQIHKDIFTREYIMRLLKDTGFHSIEINNLCYKDEPIDVNICIRATKI